MPVGEQNSNHGHCLEFIYILPKNFVVRNTTNRISAYFKEKTIDKKETCIIFYL